MTALKSTAAFVVFSTLSAALLPQTRLQAAPALAPGGAFTTLYSFGGPDGAYPEGGLVQGPDGDFYGTTFRGGASDDGTVFRLTPGGALTTLYAFKGLTDGSGPTGCLIVGKDSAFYGTTTGDSATHQDTIFRITPAGQLKTLTTLSGPSPGPMVQFQVGADGNFHQATHVVKNDSFVSMGGDALALYQFAYGETSVIPRRAFNMFDSLLEPDKDGSHYETDAHQRASGQGHLFRVAPDGTRTIVHAFTGPDGSLPNFELLRTSDGSYYGTTHRGGAHDQGTIFRWTPPSAGHSAGHS